MANGNGDDYSGLGPTVDLQNALIPPSADASEFGPPVDPTAILPQPPTQTQTNALQPPPTQTAAALAQPTRFDMTFGDSLATMQSTNRVDPRMANNRIWGVEGPKYNASNPAAFDTWSTNAVGDPPSRIADRAEYLLKQNPNFFTTDANGNPINNMFLSVGSNDPSQMKDVGRLLDTLKAANPNLHVVVPGMGPRVPTSNVDAANAALRQAVESRGYTFFQPNLQYADGVHPANSGQMFDQANTALSTAKPMAAIAGAAPTPVGLPQPGQPQTVDNALAPQGQAATPAAAAAPDSEFVPNQPRQVPISVAKQFIRAFEPGSAGYKAAWGLRNGLPDNVPVDSFGFPTQQAYPGAPIPDTMYGGRYKGSISHAAGMYQTEPGTWKEAVNGLAQQGIHITDFSPQSQEQVATWLLQHRGMGPWLPYNDRLAAAWNQYMQTGQMPQLNERGDYKAEYASSVPYHYGVTSGQSVGSGYAAGGRLANMIPQPTPTNALAVPQQTASAGGTDAQAAGAVAGSTPGGTTPADVMAQANARNEQLRRLALYQYVAQALKGARVDPRTLESGYNPGKVIEGALQPVDRSPVSIRRAAPLPMPRVMASSRTVEEPRLLQVPMAARPGQAQLLQRRSNIEGI